MNKYELNSMDLPKAKHLYEQCKYLAEMFPDDAEIRGHTVCLYEQCDDKGIVLKSIKAGRDLGGQIGFELNDLKDIPKYRLVYNPYDNELQRRIDQFEIDHLNKMKDFKWKFY